MADSDKPNGSKQDIFSEIQSDFQKFVSWMKITDSFPELKEEERKYNEDYFLALGPINSMFIRVIVHNIFLGILCYYSISKSVMYSTEWRLFVATTIILLFMTPLFIYMILMRNSYATVLKQYLILICTTIMGYIMFTRVFAGPCESNDFTQIWHCNPQASSHSLPQDSSLLLMLVPIVQITGWSEIRIETIIASWVIVMVFLCASIVYGDAYNSIPTVAVYGPICLAIIVEQRRQGLINYFYLRRLEQARQKSERQTIHFRDEFRSLIANMTHDLKTVRDCCILTHY